ncbi:ACPS domain-containing protein [Lachancea thermotolerans]|uniref:KLTH0D10956p n=1 Tax=Lachancea thermotolerans (strain ATCC 56472 / CBS 6340 / NRRL Y-8284) TaxID=559295 RepID=C5DEZ3_LACTC|nr:KLTH0D10956p [Lachancea thermotolerans CBS 6340]CAR22748.1 KLTH0D10956p [Lachancea thermotolerans CBS 6340]
MPMKRISSRLLNKRMLLLPATLAIPPHAAMLGIGTDIVYLPRFAKIVEKHAPVGQSTTFRKIATKFMHPEEVRHLYQMLQLGYNSPSVVRYLAGVWATKEAIFKSLAAQRLEIPLLPAQKIYTQVFYKTNEQDGAPRVEFDSSIERLHPEFARAYIANTRFVLSIAHDEDYLVSFVCHIRGQAAENVVQKTPRPFS